MTSRVELTRSSEKEFLALPPAVQARFRQAIEALRQEWPVTRLDVKRLQGSSAWRLRVSAYRAVFQQEGDTLVFTRFAHRSSVYR